VYRDLNSLGDILPNPLISVVILTWNRKDDLLLAINSVYSQKYEPIEVIIVDSNSTDGTQEAVLSTYPCVKYIRLPYNFGVIGGRNIGMANAEGDLFFFLDDDAELLDSDAFAKVVRRFDEEPELAVLFFRYVLEDGAQWGWALSYKPDSSWLDRELYATTFVGCAHCIHRTWVERIGYFKSEYFRDGEEADFSYRVYAEGGRVLYYPGVKVLHRLNPYQRIYADHRAHKLAHRTENDFTYLAWSDALVTVVWRLAASFMQSLWNGWFQGYLMGCSRIVKALPRIIRKRRPLDSQKMNLIRTLRCFVVSDFGLAQKRRTTLYDWIRVRICNRPRGLIEGSFANGLDC
jgi:GT2 family glycosyltransferase